MPRTYPERTTPFSVRFLPEELEGIKAAAKAAGQSYSSWVHDAAIGKLDEPAAVDARLVMLLRSFVSAEAEAGARLNAVLRYVESLETK